MKEFSIPMAIVDYIPVVLFALAMITVIRDLKKANSIGLVLLMIGAIMVSSAGFFKATYKLLYAFGAGDFVWMSNQFFSNQALGFLFCGVGLMICVMNMKSRNYAFIPTMALVGIMVVGLAAMDAGLCFLANKLKKRSALVCFIISFFLCLMMGYLSSKDFDKAFMNWLAQGINILGQLLLYLGVRILHKAGLNKMA